MEQTKKSNTLFLILVIAVGLSASLLIYSEYLQAQYEAMEMSSAVTIIRKPKATRNDTTQGILEEIEKTQLENLEGQFEEIDNELNAL